MQLSATGDTLLTQPRHHQQVPANVPQSVPAAVPHVSSRQCIALPEKGASNAWALAAP